MVDDFFYGVPGTEISSGESLRPGLDAEHQTNSRMFAPATCGAALGLDIVEELEANNGTVAHGSAPLPDSKRSVTFTVMSAADPAAAKAAFDRDTQSVAGCSTFEARLPDQTMAFDLEVANVEAKTSASRALRMVSTLAGRPFHLTSVLLFEDGFQVQLVITSRTYQDAEVLQALLNQAERAMTRLKST